MHPGAGIIADHGLAVCVQPEHDNAPARLIFAQKAACLAAYDNISVEVESGGCQFRAGSSSLKFPGYTAVYEEAADDDQKQNESRLPELKEGQTLLLDKTVPEQQFTQATLIRAMEEKGIGRPSTYAPTISTITSHDYVIKEGKYLRPTPLGEVVTKLMTEHFSDIVDLKFTNHMEARLDEIESGKSGWRDVLTEFYEGFDAEMKAAEAAMDGQRIKVPDIVSDEICDVCGKPMLIKKGRFGNFLGCSGFPECTFTKPIVVEMPGSCPKCGSKILKRTSKKGYVFYACERGTDCGFITWDVPTKNVCPECGKTMFKRSGRGPLKSFCINEACPAFVPEEKRRYPKKETAASADSDAKTKKTAKSAAKKTTVKKTAAKKSTAKKTASKKPKEES